MAGDWIKMRCNLIDDPAVLAIAAATQLDEFGVIGRLHKLWSWADQQTTDGNARGVTNVTARAWLDRYLSCPGFADALVSVGWLKIDEAGMRIPNFDRHNGQSGKQRAVTSKRVKKHREQCNADTVTPTVTSTVTPSVTQPLPEKRREEQVVNSKPSLPSQSSPVRKSQSGSGKGFDKKDLKDPKKILAYAQRRGIDTGKYENRLRCLAAALCAADGDKPAGLFVTLMDKALTGDWSTIGDQHHEPAKQWLRSIEHPTQASRSAVADDGSARAVADQLLNRLGVSP